MCENEWDLSQLVQKKRIVYSIDADDQQAKEVI
jgi:hypothetical protein